jgi:nucleoside-diphosphate-sugar epimerase
MSIFLTGATGYVGGTVARRLISEGHTVRGLVRDENKADQVRALGIHPVIGNLDDYALLVQEARDSEGVIHTADSDHTGAVNAFIEGLSGSEKLLIHTSGSSVIGDDALGIHLSTNIFDEDTPFIVEPKKQPRRDIELKILASSKKGIRSVVICPSNIYGTGSGVHQRSVQIPFLVDQSRENKVVRIVGSGINRWSNVHIDDIAELYFLAFQKALPGSFFFAESGEASFAEIGNSIATRLELGPVESWSVDEASERWGYLHAHYTFGSNSRVRAKHARADLGWAPVHTSVTDWIERDMPL